MNSSLFQLWNLVTVFLWIKAFHFCCLHVFWTAPILRSYSHYLNLNYGHSRAEKCSIQASTMGLGMSADPGTSHETIFRFTSKSNFVNEVGRRKRERVRDRGKWRIEKSITVPRMWWLYLVLLNQMNTHFHTLIYCLSRENSYYSFGCLQLLSINGLKRIFKVIIYCFLDHLCVVFRSLFQRRQSNVFW